MLVFSFDHQVNSAGLKFYLINLQMDFQKLHCGSFSFCQSQEWKFRVAMQLNVRENTAKSSVIPSSNMLAVSFYHQVNSAGLKSYLFFFLPPHICPCL